MIEGTHIALDAKAFCDGGDLFRLGRGKFVLDGLGWKDKNQRTYYYYTTTVWWLSTLRCN